MKRVYDNIEEQYKNQFDNYQHDFDQTAMWQSLDAALPQQSQPKVAIFALASAFVVSILAGALWMNYDTSQANFASEVEVEKKLEVATQTQHENLAIASHDEQTAIPSITANPLIVPSEQTLQQANTTRSEETNFVEKTAYNSNAEGHKTTAIASNKTAQNPLRLASAKAPSIEALQNSFVSNTAKANTMMDLDENPIVFPSIRTQNKTQQLQNRMSLLPSISSTSILTPNLLQKETTLRDGDLSCPMVGGKRRTPIKGHGFIDIYGEGDFNMTTIESQNTDTDAYETSWNDTDTPLGSYEFGVLLGYEFDGGLYAGLGLEYQKTVEKLEYQQTVIQRVTVWSEEAYFYIDESGNQVFVADSVTTQSVYERSVKSGKEHTIINLPLILGYNIHANDWNIGVFGGANINLSHKFEGKIINESNAFVALNEDNYETVYKRKLGASFFAGLHLGHNIGSSMELYLNPTVRIYPNSWMQDDYSLSAKYRLAGLRLGLRYKM